jgi:hypothetical protein
VCGGRDFNDHRYLYEVLDRLTAQAEAAGLTPFFINGGASGADGLSILYATARGYEYEVFHADWEKFGKAAGPMRNMEMLQKGKPDVVVAFEGGRGTANMVKLAKEAGVKVFEQPKKKIDNPS